MPLGSGTNAELGGVDGSGSGTDPSYSRAASGRGPVRWQGRSRHAIEIFRGDRDQTAHPEGIGERAVIDCIIDHLE